MIKFVNRTVLFVIILMIGVILLTRNRDSVEKYTENEVLTAKYVSDQLHGSRGGRRIILSSRRADGVLGNSTVEKQCPLVKAWFLEQIESGSDVYKLSSKSTLLSLGRNDAYDCIDDSSVVKFLKDREVAKKDVVIYNTEDDLLAEKQLESKYMYTDGLDRKYFAYYIGRDDEETTNKQFDIEGELDKKDKKSGSPVKFIIVPNNLQKTIALNFKKTIGIGSNYCKSPTSDQVDAKKKIRLINLQFDRHYKKIGEGNTFSIVYRETEGDRRIVEISDDITSFPVFRQKYCATECSKITNKPDMWVKASDNKSFGRVNYVDLINNPTKVVCERVSINGKEINSTDELVVQEKAIDKSRYEYKEDSDQFRIRYKYNSEDFYYVNADPKFEIPLTKCELNKTYQTIAPQKKVMDMDKKEWIYVTDRTCEAIDPCDRIDYNDIRFDFTSAESKPGQTITMAPREVEPNEFSFAECCGIQILYTLIPLETDGTLPSIVDPIFTILKKDKEAICKLKIEAGDKSLLVGELCNPGEDPAEPAPKPEPIPVPVHCDGTWSDWSYCSAPCGDGTQTRSWNTTTPPLNGGKACPSPSTQTISCRVKDCPPEAVNCEGTWSAWSDCSEQCGEGTQTRSWNTTTQPKHGGQACPSPEEESKSCKIKDCPPVKRVRIFQIGDLRRPKEEPAYTIAQLKAQNKFKWPFATKAQLEEGFEEFIEGFQEAEKSDFEFQPFKIFDNDQFTFVIQTGNYGFRLTEMTIIFKCKKSERIRTAATLRSDNVCEYPSYDKCEYDKSYYEKDDAGDYSCAQYTGLDKCTEENVKYSWKDMSCGGVSQTKYANVDIADHVDNTLVNPSLKLDLNIKDCMTMCDEREGCYGADLNTITHSCALYGHETTKVVVNSGAALSIDIQHSGNQKREGANEIVFQTPVNINRITVTGNPTSLILYNETGSVQKQYDAQKLSLYRQSEGVFVIDDVYA